MNSDELESSDAVQDLLDIEDLDVASSKIDNVVHGIIELDAPSWYINPAFQTLFKERSTYDSVAAASPLTMASGLDDVLSDPDPPSLDFLRSLPMLPKDAKFWAIYGIVMEKAGCDPDLYCGSGTDADVGASSRLKNYTPLGSNLPPFIKLRFQQGYHISHIGLLCRALLPTPGLVPRVRARFLLLEAAFTIVFHAAFEASTDSFLSHLYLWPREAVSWGPLCSHLPLNEAIRGNLDMSPEELEIIAALRTAQLAKNALERSRRYRAKQTEEDPVGFLQKNAAAKLSWSINHRDQVNKTATKGRASRIEKKQHHCHDCDTSLQSAHALEKHLASQDHKDRAAGRRRNAPSDSAVAVAAVRANAKANKTHHCLPCNKSFSNDWSLTRHQSTGLHARRFKAFQDSQN